MKPIWNIAEVLVQLGVRDVVLCPGSRCAPLLVAFNRHPKINCYSISDERSAGFFALGMAQKTGQATVIVCTSGSAALNFYPAISEAFYQKIPLLVLTADRPPEWIDQGDGQTIRQEEVFRNHILKSYTLPSHYEPKDVEWSVYRKVSEAYNTAFFDKGPVHINIPFREPFYPSEEEVVFDPEVKVIKRMPTENHIPEDVLDALRRHIARYSKILIIAGQGDFNPVFQQKLKSIPSPMVAENLSNIPHGIYTVRQHDTILSPARSEEALALLEPELIISFGGAILSKNLKLFLRKSKAEHWHIGKKLPSQDVFQKLTREIPCTAEYFFSKIKVQSEESFLNSWQSAESRASKSIVQFLNEAPFGEFKAVFESLKKMPPTANLHLANSMSVRYANFFDLKARKVFANRGTSGIDGSSSTAVGISLKSDNLNVLLTGDLSFFYDRNAFWNNYVKNNFRIILLNNGGGGIFDLINGPSSQKELDEFFVTDQRSTAKFAAMEFGMRYEKITNDDELTEVLANFYKPQEEPVLMEIVTTRENNKTIFEQFKQLAHGI